MNGQTAMLEKDVDVQAEAGEDLPLRERLHTVLERPGFETRHAEAA